jgi:ATP-dependent DNA ligase
MSCYAYPPGRFVAPALVSFRLAVNGSAEIKYDGFRVIAWKDGPQVRLYSRPGNDLSRW